MSENPLVLTIDCGTQSFRVLLVDKKGQIVAKEQEYFLPPYFSVQTGYFEQKPEVYWNAICKICNNLKKNNADKWEQIKAVTCTTFRDTCVCVDKDGKVLRDIILWLDQREIQCKKPLPLLNRILFKIVGMAETVKVQRRISKCNWIRETEPKVWAKTYKYLMFSGYINFLLTGKMVDSIASQVGHIPFHYKNKKWKSTSDLQFEVFGISKDKLPSLVEPGEIIGYITKEASSQCGIKEGLPLIATGSDKGCETLGCGVVENDMASLSFGSAATVQLCTKKYIEPSPFLPAYPSAVKGYYNPEIQIFSGYWMINWFKNQFAQAEVLQAQQQNVKPEKLLDEFLENIPAGCDGLLLQPFWSPMLKNPESKGSVIGFSSQHTRGHFYKAIVEGIGYALLNGMRSMEKRVHKKIKAITVSGGGSQSDAICQITADMFGVEVKRIQTYEACGIGSSIVAFVAMGEYENCNQAIQNMVRYTDIFYPNIAAHKYYTETYRNVYCKMYGKLQPLYKYLYYKGKLDKR